MDDITEITVDVLKLPSYIMSINHRRNQKKKGEYDGRTERAFAELRSTGEDEGSAERIPSAHFRVPERVLSILEFFLEMAASVLPHLGDFDAFVSEFGSVRMIGKIVTHGTEKFRLIQ